MEVRAAQRGERDEVLDLLARWYNDREFFARYNHNDPGFRDALCIVARDRGQLVSTVQIFDRAISLDADAARRRYHDARGLRSILAVRGAPDLLQPIRMA